jgi:hypothetical protein
MQWTCHVLKKAPDCGIGADMYREPLRRATELNLSTNFGLWLSTLFEARLFSVWWRGVWGLALWQCGCRRGAIPGPCSVHTFWVIAFTLLLQKNICVPFCFSRTTRAGLPLYQCVSTVHEAPLVRHWKNIKRRNLLLSLSQCQRHTRPERATGTYHWPSRSCR